MADDPGGQVLRAVWFKRKYTSFDFNKLPFDGEYVIVKWEQKQLGIFEILLKVRERKE